MVWGEFRGMKEKERGEKRGMRMKTNFQRNAVEWVA